MFDTATTVNINCDTGPGVVLDLSAVYGNSEALPLVMIAATHCLTAALTGRPERRSIQVIDEAWAAIRHAPPTGTYARVLQAGGQPAAWTRSWRPTRRA